MCDIGKGVTRMLTPSENQIRFVQAAAPIATTAINAAASSGGLTRQQGTLDFLAADQHATYGSSGYGSALDQQRKKQTINTALIVGGVVVAAAIVFWPK